ncbi:MAG: hypothetical protein UHS54_06170 [Lachnospiraceae bacterium]|nr:hypothetical protein [Lachnospiraceae bacterium]MEE1247732.1 hypothetical protein [Lachnospiraceae bacterium]
MILVLKEISTRDIKEKYQKDMNKQDGNFLLKSTKKKRRGDNHA